MSNYKYQIPAAKSIFEMATSGEYQAAVLAAAPSSGKSTIIIHILNMFFNQFPEVKVIILTHNQNMLKEQMLDGFTDGFVKPNFTFGEFGSNAQVQVGIPSSRSKITSMDVLVVDEAHHYYGAAMVNSIVSTFNPKYQILMTGSPSIYNEVNSNSTKPVYGMYYISGDQLVEQNVYSNVVIDVAEVHADNVIDNYNTAIKKLSQDKRFNSSKLMIACKTVNDAYVLGIHLRNNGRKIAISTSANDSGNEQIRRFKSGEADTLLVVNKGILGFSDNFVTALIDLKGSKDIDARNQLFARIFRKHPDGIEKFYISVSTKINWNKEITILKSVVGLMNTNTFKTYTK